MDDSYLLVVESGGRVSIISTKERSRYSVWNFCLILVLCDVGDDSIVLRNIKRISENVLESLISIS